MNKLGKQILALSIVTAFFSIFIFSASYFYIYNKIYSDLQKTSRTAVEKAVKAIDGDKISAIITENNMDSTDFKEMYDSMIRFKADKNVRYLYTFSEIDDKNVAYIVDASVEDACPIGETYPIDEDMKKAFNGEVVSTNKVVTDEYGSFISAYAPIKDSSGKVVAIVGADQDVGIYNNIAKVLIKLIILIIFSVIFISIVLAVAFSKKLNKSITIIETNLGLMAEGDLTNPVLVNRKDEIGRIAKDIDAVRISNSVLLSEVKGNSKQVLDGVNDLSYLSNVMTDSADHVAEIVKGLSLSAVAQAHSLNEISSNMAKFGYEIDEISGLAEDTNSNVKNINGMAQSGNMELQSLIKQLSEVKEVFKNLSDKIIILSTQIEKISDITDMINGVADQTNLLALNAAIEASRAGEAGRGFSVVADEIRKLSEQSKDSSQQINELIKNISSNSKEAVYTTENVSEKLNEQINVIETSLLSFKAIIESIDIIVPKVEKIRDSAITINSEKNVILDRVKELDNSAGETSSSAVTISNSVESVSGASRKVCHTAETLNEMAVNMMKQTDKFKL
ncbi:MAG: methyl-accepting chemotaxis protein [Solirubrobacterales bacterium]